MTEEEWLIESDPFKLIGACKVSQRKGKLFVVGCCLQHKSVIGNRLNRKAIYAVEKYADGQIEYDELRANFGSGKMGYRIATACSIECPIPMFVILGSCMTDDLKYEQIIECQLIRDIFGNPFRPVVADPAGLTPTVVGIASAIYADRVFDRMPILADALEEAGCTNADVLLHCRGAGPHVRGCWVVDLVLGKE